MNVIECLKASLEEDVRDGDITSNLLLDSKKSVTAQIIAKATGIFCGESVIDAAKKLYPNLKLKKYITDGYHLTPNDICVDLEGSIKDIVILERTLLNFLQRLSGVATITNKFVKQLDDSSIQVLDTRKTTPLMRQLEKQAVLAGGGYNHRFGLYDMILVKENHLVSYINEFGIDQFHLRLKSHRQSAPSISIEVEVNSFNLLSKLNLNLIDIIMLDNMNMDELNRCIDFINKSKNRPLKEVSGNISLKTIGNYRGIDIDRISVGSLTHSVKALDLSLLVR